MGFFKPLVESRANIENPLVPLTSANVLSYFQGMPTDAGVSVNEISALQIAAVWRAVNLIAGTSASLPLHTFVNGSRKRTVNRLLDFPHPDLTPYELWEWAYTSVALWGNAYFRKVRNAAGMQTWLLPIDPGAVKVGRTKYDPDLNSSKVFEVRREDGGTYAWTSYEVLHIPGFGYDGTCGTSPIAMARQSLGMTIAAERHGARLFGGGSMPAGLLTSDDRLTPADAEVLKARWKERVRGRGDDIAVLGQGMRFQPITMPNTDAQFLESRQFQVAEIARWFGIPPHMLYDVDRSTSWGTGIEQQGIQFVVYSLRPWLTRFEQRITREATPQGNYSKYVVEGLMRGDSAARAAFYTQMLNNGALNIDEVRDLEDREPLPGGLGQMYRGPLNMAPLGAAPEDNPLDPNES